MEPQAEEEVGGKPSCSFLPRKKKAVMPAIGTFLTSVVIFLKSAFMRRSILEKGVLKRHTTRDQLAFLRLGMNARKASPVFLMP
eukprot:scaffold262394_cov21-Tisochrysis_lutea.AAC.1